MKPAHRWVRIRRTLAVVPVCALLAAGVVGCDRPTDAATVNGGKITVSSLRSLVRSGLRDDAFRSQWTGKQQELTRKVLSHEIEAKLVEDAATKRGVSVTNGDIQVVQTAVSALDASSLAQYGIVPNQRKTFARMVALGARIAVDSGVSTPPDSVTYGFIRVPDTYVASAVSAAVQANPAAYTDIAKPYTTGGATLAKPATSSATQLERQAPLATAAVNKAERTGRVQVLQQPAQGQSGQDLLFVISVRKVTLESLEEMADPSSAQAFLVQAYSAGAKKGLWGRDARIKVNPRYGRWNPSDHAIDGGSDPGLILSK